MELDQKVFAWAWKLGKRWFGKPTPPTQLDAHLPALQLFATLVVGRAVEIVGVAQAGGLRGARLQLPLGCTLFEDTRLDLDFLRMRILLLAAGEVSPGPGTLQTSAEHIGTPSTFRARLRAVYEQFPQAPQLFANVRKSIRTREALETTGPHKLSEKTTATRSATAKRSGTSATAPLPNGPRALLTDFPQPLATPEFPQSKAPTINTKKKDESKPLDEIKVQNFDESQMLKVNEQEITDYTLGHNFEKIETLDDFAGNWRDLDEEQDLSEASEALQELRFAHRIRTNEAPRSMVNADTPPGTIADAAETENLANCILYDEWDQAKRSYRRDFCRLYESEVRDSRPGFVQALLQKNRKLTDEADARLRRALLELQSVRRERTGESPDLDAVVNARADVLAGHTPDDRLYQTKRRRKRDLSIHFLIDLSLSTDAWVRGQRILDTERDAVAICCEVLERYDTNFAISGFYSRTRNDCRYQVIKSFSQSWQSCRDRLAVLTPTGYTRIGPAIRRTTDLLARQRTAQRWMLLFSDARPSDYDRYEGRYGLADVRQAVREAEVAGIGCHGFGVQTAGRTSLEQMLGAGRGELLPGPAQLPLALIRFTERLLA